METIKYQVEGMDCADCALKIEKGVQKIEGVHQVQVNFAAGVLVVEGTASPQIVQERVEALGYQITQAPLLRKPRPRQPFLAGLLRFMLGTFETRLALIGGGMIGAAFLAGSLGIDERLTNAVQIIALIIAGFPIARSGISNLIINRDFNINLLMSIAAVGAIIIGEIPEGASLIFLYAVAEALEGYTTDRARSVLGELSDLAPTQAVKLTGGHETLVPVEQLVIGDRILIKPGERIPMDGSILSGHSEVNQAPITGESMPVTKEPGSEVFAGTVNGSGSLEVEVTRLVQDNTLNRIIQLVEEAQTVRAPSQRFIDQFARYYTPAMIVLAALIAIIPPLFLGEPLTNLPDGTRGWLYRGLALLVIGCPCALVISTPVTILSSITAAARRGVLIKGGIFLESLNRVKTIAFDKTGTLTQGTPIVTTTRSMDCAGGETCADCDEVLALACSLERRSSHPLAQAVIQAAQERGLADRYDPAEAVTALAGLGLQGQVNGKLATIGNHRLFDAEHGHSDELCRWIENAENLGQTTMLVCDGDRVRGYLAVSDTLRPDSPQVVQELKRAGMTVAMLTGDNPQAAQAVADQIGIEKVFASLLPADKVNAVRSLHDGHGAVAMVGDGINDTPALAAATVGIAMGGASSAQALETADVVLMSDQLDRLPFTFRLAKLSHRLITENIVFSLVTKLIFILLALAGWTPMWLAVVGDMGVSLAVTFNGMRPLVAEKRGQI